MERKPIGWGRVIRRHRLWLVLVPLVFALIFGGVGWYQAGNAELLDRHGVDTLARITDREIRTRRDRDGDEQTDYLLSYAFDAGLGETVTGRQAVSSALYRRTRIGDDIPVRYVAHRPDVHEIEPGASRFLAWVFGGFGLLFGAITFGLGYWLMRRKASLIRAARGGEVREAEVVSHQPSSITVNNQRLMEAQWRDARGEMGASTPARPEDLPAIGSVIAVYVDPATGRGWWDGDF